MSIFLEQAADDIINIINQHLSLFKKFKSVYLFGSVLDGTNTVPKDIDILLIYSVLPPDLRSYLTLIRSELEKSCGLPIDLTVLSYDEEQDVQFLHRLQSFYKVK